MTPNLMLIKLEQLLHKIKANRRREMRWILFWKVEVNVAGGSNTDEEPDQSTLEFKCNHWILMIGRYNLAKSYTSKTKAVLQRSRLPYSTW